VSASSTTSNNWLLPAIGIGAAALAGGLLYNGFSSIEKPGSQPDLSVKSADSERILPDPKKEVETARHSADTAQKKSEPTEQSTHTAQQKSEMSQQRTDSADLSRNAECQTEAGKATSAQKLPKPKVNAAELAKGAEKISVFALPAGLGGMMSWSCWQGFQKASSAIPVAATRVANLFSSSLPDVDTLKPAFSAAASAAQEVFKPGQDLAASAVRQLATIAQSAAAQAIPSRSSVFGVVGLGLAGLGLYLFSKPEPQSANTSETKQNASDQNIHNRHNREQRNEDKAIAAFIQDPANGPQKARRFAQFIKQDKELVAFLTQFYTHPQQHKQAEATQLMDKYVTSLLTQGKRHSSASKDEVELVIELLHTKARIPIPPQLKNGTLTLPAALRKDRIELFATALKGMTTEESALLLNQKDHSGQTALQIAVQSKHLSAVKALLKKGADPFMLDAHKKTSWDHLWEFCSNNQLKTLLQAYDPASLDCSKQLQLSKELTQVRKDGQKLVVQASPGTDLRLNTLALSENTPVKARAGYILQVNNALYKVTPELRLVKISSNARLVNYLFPQGVDNLIYKQGRMRDCAKLTQMHSLLDDPSGMSTRALLDRFSEDEQHIYLESSTGTKKFNKSNFWTDQHGNLVYRRRPDDRRPVTGPLGIQLLERGHYRDVREDAAIEDADPVNDLASVAGTLASSNMNKDRSWSDDYGIGILGLGFWLPHTQDGSVESGAEPPDWGFSQKQNWGNKKTVPLGARTGEEKKRLEEFLTQFEKDPSSFRGIVSTKFDERRSAESEISLRDSSEKLFTRHAYYFKCIFRSDNNKRIFQVVNPHDGSRIIDLSERDFMNNFYIFNGITPRVQVS